jgi:hypothetical protein
MGAVPSVLARAEIVVMAVSRVESPALKAARSLLVAISAGEKRKPVFPPIMAEVKASRWAGSMTVPGRERDKSVASGERVVAVIDQVRPASLRVEVASVNAGPKSSARVVPGPMPLIRLSPALAVRMVPSGAAIRAGASSAAKAAL